MSISRKVCNSKVIHTIIIPITRFENIAKWIIFGTCNNDIVLTFSQVHNLLLLIISDVEITKDTLVIEFLLVLLVEYKQIGFTGIV